MAKIAKVMLEDPSVERYGLEVRKIAGLGTGTLYPALRRLEALGWLTSRIEELPPDEVRPPRRMYRLTGAGERAARDYLARAEERFGAAQLGAGWSANPGGAQA
jgi:DNA-binding PadR family transcriptional regulator